MASQQAKDFASKQGVVRIGDIVPDFQQSTTQGEMSSFHKEIEGSWAILFSHPKAFTPICTTELAEVAKKQNRFDELGVKVFGLSVDLSAENQKWITDIEAFAGAPVKFPIICDSDYTVSLKYGMVNQDHVDAKGMPFTVRSVFFINPQKKCMAQISYPANVGRNFDEIFRVLEALQLTEKHSVACPVSWTKGKDVVVPPFVSTDDAKEKYGEVDIKYPYLRFVKDPSAL